jgi:hypothetical protein
MFILYPPLGPHLETCAALQIERITQWLLPEPLSMLDPDPLVFPRS